MFNYDINLKLFNVSRIQKGTYNSFIRGLSYYIHIYICYYCNITYIKCDIPLKNHNTCFTYGGWRGES